MKVLTAAARGGKANTQSYYYQGRGQAQGPRNGQFGPPAAFGWLSAQAKIDKPIKM